MARGGRGERGWFGRWSGCGRGVVGGFEGAVLLADEFGLGRHEFAGEGFGEGGLGEPVGKREKRSPWSRRNRGFSESARRDEYIPHS